MSVILTSSTFQFAELETFIGDVDRARSIYEYATTQPQLDMPDLIWKSYIEFEVGQNEREKARKLYERLLEKTEHFKVSCLCSFLQELRSCIPRFIQYN